MLHKERSQLCRSAVLSYRLVLYQTALVKTELATECPSAVKKDHRHVAIVSSRCWDIIWIESTH